MTSPTSSATAAQAFRRSGGVAEKVRHHRGTRRLSESLELLLVVGFRLLAAAALHGGSGRGAVSKAAALDDLDEVDLAPPLIVKAAQPAPGDWLFPSFFLCMAVAVLPLLGLCWTTPEGLTTWRVFVDALVFSLPVIFPLPFLFAGCIFTLAARPASRTSEALGFLVMALVMAFAGLHSVCA
jgi:hypothetical protein